MQKLKILLLFGILFSINACSPKINLSDGVISIDVDDFVNPVENGEDLIKTMEFIPLETREGFFVPGDANIKNRRGYWLIGNFDQLLIFDHEGKIVSRINAKGNGPEEYAWIADYDLLPDRDEIVLCDNRNMTFFTLDGRFLSKKPIPFIAMNIAALGDDYFAFTPERYRMGRDESVGKYQFYILNREGEIIQKKFEFPWYILNEYYRNFKSSSDPSTSLFTLAYVFNVYQVGPGLSVKLKYTFDYGELMPDTSFLQQEKTESTFNLSQFNTGKYLGLDGFMETSGSILVRSGSDKHQMMAFRLFSRKTGEQKTLLMNDPPQVGSYYGWPIYPFFCSTGDYYYHPISALDVQEIIGNLSDEEKLALSKCRGFEKLSKLDIEDNPLIVLYLLNDF